MVESAALSVAEGSTVNIRARLTAAPSSNVTVTASESAAELSVAPSTRTFTPTNWETYQNFTVTGIADSDTDDEARTVVLTATGGSTDTQDVVVTVTEPSVPLSLPDPSNLNLTVGVAINVLLPAASGGSGGYVYAVSSLGITGLAFSPSTRRLTGTPTTAQTDSSVIYRVTDSDNDTTTQAFSIAVVAAAAAPGIPTTPTLVSRTANSVTVRTTPGSGGAVTTYRWRYSTNVTLCRTQDPHDHVVWTQRIRSTGLSPDTDYWIDVRGENDEGDSDYSDNLGNVHGDGRRCPARRRCAGGDDWCRRLG